MEKGDTKKELWDKLVMQEAGARTARFGRRVVIRMKAQRRKERSNRRR